MIAESPRVRMSRARHRRVRALRRAVRPPLLPAGDGAPTSTRWPRQANRIRVVPVEAPRGRILDRNGKVLVDNRISVQVTIDRTVLDELDDDERTARAHRGSPTGLARAGTPKTVERARGRPRRRALQPLRAGARSPATCPRTSKIWIDEHAAELPGRGGRARGGAPLPVRPAGRPRARLHRARSTTTSSRRKADSPKPYTLNDEIGKYGVEKIYEDDLRGTPGLAVDRGRRREPARSAIVEREPTRSPATTSCLNLDIDVQAQAEQALPVRARPSPRTGPAPGARSPPKAEDGLRGRPRPEDRRGARDGVVPDLRPGRLRRRHQRRRVGRCSPRRRTTRPLNNWAIQGQYAPGSTFKPFTAVAGARGGPDHARHHGLRRRRVRGARLHRRLVRVQQRPGASRTAWSTCAGRSPCRPTSTTTASAPSSGASRTASAGPSGTPTSSSSGASAPTPGIDLPSEQAGRIPSPTWLADYCEPTSGCVDGADSWRTGNNVNMAIGQGDVLLTPAAARRRLRHHRQRRHASGSRTW